MTVDNDLKEMMRDLGHALAHAIATSPQAADTVRKIRHQGYSLYLMIDRDEGDDATQIELAPAKVASSRPGFLLNKDDVTFLESVGIDATRPSRRRRAP